MAISLRVTDVNDREILRAIWDNADADGWTDLETVAEAFFPAAMRGNKKRLTALHSAGARLNYMRRIGVVERRVMHDKETHARYTKWTLTKDGELFLLGNLTPPQQRAIETAMSKDGSMLQMAGILMEHYVKDFDELSATMFRRQWLYGYGQRRRS